MVASVTAPSSSAVRVVIGGITIRFGISTGPMRAGVRRMFMAQRISPFVPAHPPTFARATAGTQGGNYSDLSTCHPRESGDPYSVRHRLSSDYGSRLSLRSAGTTAERLRLRTTAETRRGV